MLGVSGGKTARITPESSRGPNFALLPWLGKIAKLREVLVMKNRSILLIALLVVVAFVAGFSAAGRQRWEYQQTCADRDLNELGANGWELVSVTSQSADAKCFYLKRSK
jgi:hypothetical protein